MGYVLVGVVLMFSILVHEFGHFVAARMTGMPVTTFSIGFGPRLLRWKRGETEFALSLIPVGGYVQVEIEDNDEYYQLPLVYRLYYSMSGPVFNVIFALLLLYIVSFASGSLFRDGGWLTPWITVGEITQTLFSILPSVIEQPQDLSGVIGIIDVGGEVVGTDVIKALIFAAFISINLAFFNLLPLPPLDGGKIRLDVIHAVFPKAKMVYGPIIAIGTGSLLFLFLYVTLSDLIRLI